MQINNNVITFSRVCTAYIYFFFRKNKTCLKPKDSTLKILDEFIFTTHKCVGCIHFMQYTAHTHVSQNFKACNLLEKQIFVYLQTYELAPTHPLTHSLSVLCDASNLKYNNVT